MKEITITKLDANQRLDKYVRKYLCDAPLSFIYRLFRKKDIKVNAHWQNANYIIKENDVISIYVSDAQLQEFAKPKAAIKKEFKHPIIYEDENIIIVNKPRGLLVHGDINEKRITLANEVMNYLYFKGDYNPNVACGFTPAPAHRLDRNTSGLVVFAKNLVSLQVLEKLFKDRTNIKKNYLALVVGRLSNNQIINLPLLKDEKSGLVKVASYKDGAKEAISEVSINKLYDSYTLVDVHLITGKTHQIRVHLSAINHPVVGDGKYGDFIINREFKTKFNFENQFLHAYQMSFKAVDSPLEYLANKTFIAPLPKIEQSILSKLDKKL